VFPPGYTYTSKTDAKADYISAFSFVLKIEGQPPIRIPVIKDHLDFGSVVLPKSFHISETVPTEDAAYLEDMYK